MGFSLSRVSVALAVLLGAAHVRVGICKTAKVNPATSVPAWALNEKDTTTLGSTSGSCNNYGCNPGSDGKSYPCESNGYCYEHCCNGSCSEDPCPEDDDTVDDEEQSNYSKLSHKYRKFLHRKVCVKSRYCLSIAGIIGIVFLLGLLFFAATKKRENPVRLLMTIKCPAARLITLVALLAKSPIQFIGAVARAVRFCSMKAVGAIVVVLFFSDAGLPCAAGRPRDLALVKHHRCPHI